MDFKQKNDWTYLYNQQNESGRGKLVDIIEKTTSLNSKQAAKSALSACYMVSFIFDIWFKTIEKTEISIDDIFQYLFDYEYFRAVDCYQNYSSKDILYYMKRDGLIDEHIFIDKDSSYPGESRKSIFMKLQDYMMQPDFKCCRVCFGSDAASDHALMVATDEQGRPVVMDTSWRPHEWDGNQMERYVNSDTIRWFTSVESV